MKIISHGTDQVKKENEGRLIFLCMSCGCLFVADEDEWSLYSEHDLYGRVECMKPGAICPDCGDVTTNKI